jgi:hypothetical protein
MKTLKINSENKINELALSRLNERDVIGFDNFKQAQDFVADFGGEIALFQKRDGGHYRYTGSTYQPLTCFNYVNDLGDNYSIVDNEGEIDFLKNEAKEAFEADDLEKAKAFISRIEELNEVIDWLEDDEVIISGSESYEVCKKEMMAYHEDVTAYSVGVRMDEEQDVEEEQE